MPNGGATDYQGAEHPVLTTDASRSEFEWCMPTVASDGLLTAAHTAYQLSPQVTLRPILSSAAFAKYTQSLHLI
jgi:hypothetical protein